MFRLLHSSLSFRIKSNFQPSRDCLIALTNWNINGRKILFHIVARTIFRYILYNLLRLTLLTFNDIPAARELARSSSLIDRFGKRSPPNSIVSKSKSGIGRQRDVEVFKKGPWRGKACVVPRRMRRIFIRAPLRSRIYVFGLSQIRVLQRLNVLEDLICVFTLKKLYFQSTRVIVRTNTSVEGI